MIGISKVEDLTPCSPVEVYRHFSRKYCLHFQGRWISCIRNDQEAGRKQCVLSKRRWTFTGLHDITFQKMVLVIVIATRASNLACSQLLTSIELFNYREKFRELLSYQRESLRSVHK
jgi:hypothetical protein